MRVTEFLNQYLKETSCLRLQKHCRDMAVSAEDWSGQIRNDGSYAEYISSIMLWGLPGRITLKLHFDIDTAVKWAAFGLEKSEDDIEDSIAVDFFRELSNLHAGYLRGIFEGNGILFGMSLPFIIAGDSEETLQSLQKKQLESGAEFQSTSWVLTDGHRKIIYTVEIEMKDWAAIANIQGALEAALQAEKQSSSADDGDVEFLL